MALQYSVSIRNAVLDVVETTTGTAPTLTIRTGAPPATADLAATGTVLATVVLPSNWMDAASGGVKSAAGSPWIDLTADDAGTAGHFRIVGSGGTWQGTASGPLGGGDMIVDNPVIAVNQQVSVNSLTLNFPA